MGSIAANSNQTRLLMTGFGSFPGAPSNPTLLIIARLARSGRLSRAGVVLVTRALPVGDGGGDLAVGTTSRGAQGAAQASPRALVRSIWDTVSNRGKVPVDPGPIAPSAAATAGAGRPREPPPT